MSQSLPSWARVGAKVVCVNDDEEFCLEQSQHLAQSLGRKLVGGLDGLTKGEVYTVREVVIVLGEVTLQLKEITRPTRIVNVGFYIARFRPLVTIEDDIATHFSQHLNVRQPRKIGADA